MQQLGSYCKWHHLLLTWQFLCRPGPQGHLGTGPGTSAPSGLPGSTSTSSAAEPRAGSGGLSSVWQETAAWAGGGAGLQLCVPRAPQFHNCPSSWASPLKVVPKVPVLVTWCRALVAGLALALPGPGRAVSRQGAEGGSRTRCLGQEVFWDAAEPSRLCTSPWKHYFVAASRARPAASSREAAAVDSSLLPSAATRAALPRPPRPQLCSLGPGLRCSCTCTHREQ